MHVNNLGGARMPVTTTTAGASQTARTSFGTLLQGGAGAPMAGRAGISGSSIIASAISANSGAVPGATFGAPYLQAMPQTATAPATGTTTPGTAPAANAGTEFNGELAQMMEKQKALKEIVMMSMTSFISSTFAMGQNRPGIESL